MMARWQKHTAHGNDIKQNAILWKGPQGRCCSCRSDFVSKTAASFRIFCPLFLHFHVAALCLCIVARPRPVMRNTLLKWPGHLNSTSQFQHRPRQLTATAKYKCICKLLCNCCRRNCDTDVASLLKLCQRHVSFTPCPISEGGKFKANTLPKGNAPDELGLATSSPGRSD